MPAQPTPDRILHNLDMACYRLSHYAPGQLAWIMAAKQVQTDLRLLKNACLSA